MTRMQTELHTGIDLALDLIRQPDRRALLDCAHRQLGEAFGVSRSWLFELDASGRDLVCPALTGETTLACDDFRHPMAHVIRSDAARVVRTADRVRYEHPVLDTMLDALAPGESLWLSPVRVEQGSVLGVLALAGDPGSWEGLTGQPLFQGFLRLLAGHWRQHLDRHDRLWQQRLLHRSLAHLKDSESDRRKNEQLAATLIGHSRAMADLRSQIVRAAGTQLSVLIQGETGCGKDLVARGLHDFSQRADGPYVVVNCAAIPDSLLESELFGHTKGAFSGADRAREGLLAQADGGTLFLDEIGDMPMALQSKLLRVLETQRFRPLGGQTEQRSDFRIVAATHQPLQSLIRENRFRRDLYYRLSQFPVKVTPLRERGEDLEALSRAFITAYREREGSGPLGISSQALRFLSGYRFPGNVRELRNVIEFACIQAADGADVQAEDLRLDMMAPVPGEDDDETGEGDADLLCPGLPPLHEIDDLREAARAFEAAIISARLRQYQGNRAQAAESLGLPKRTLAHKCQKFNVTLEAD
ncbi:sigma-54-specific transcriptional regulator [Tamilnaduibacter salinus]|uniref:Sigma-54-specific transcriptional regulator n=1 Tax=Tamilnaduibacter salinus TaxID=1484056 RepID=A0A2U1CYU8_9GAMM|nr:sigma-54-specific transcriptional regulator [Tamilnaduibacter salinus]